jgi:hypothetical protein
LQEVAITREAAMDDLYKIGQTVGQENAGAPQSFNPMQGSAFADAMADPKLAELLGGGGDIEQYLQQYEQMLAECAGGGGLQLNQVDAEGGIHVRPDAGFVVKTRDVASGMKVFMNIVSNEHVEKPHMKSFADIEGEQGCRVPLSIGTPVEDFDKKGEPCVTYDLVANPEVVEECGKEPNFKETVIHLCLSALAQKYKVELDTRYKIPKMKYKGNVVQVQRLRKQNQSRIQEVGSQKAGAGGEQEEQRKEGPEQPEFVLYYTTPEAPVVDGFAETWGPPPDELEDVGTNLYGFDLPLYRVDEFQERIRGTMKNKADREKEEQAKEGTAKAEEKPGVAETREMLKGRTCVVQVRMPDLDRTVASLRQFKVEVSDECLRVSFPMLPRSGKSVYAPLAIWWPQHFNSGQASSSWDPKKDVLTVTLPVDPPEELRVAAEAFDAELLDMVF